jgi:nitroreductase
LQINKKKRAGGLLSFFKPKFQPTKKKSSVMEDFKSLIRHRQSVRRYTDRPIDDDTLSECLEAARLAPSASNSQPWTFVVVNDPPLVKQVAEATYDQYIQFNRFVPQAPVIVALVIEKPRLITRVGSLIKDRDFQWTDHGIAAAHLCLAAASLGVGTCMLGWFNERKVKKLLGIPRNKRLSMLISMGYAPDDYPVREKIRKPAASTLFFNAYGKTTHGQASG